jgi:hypothetical protein
VTPKKDLPPDFLIRLNAVVGKRPRTVIQHILEYGFITTDELKEKYGYNHPPRAIRDVKELGIPLVRTTVKGPDGHSIASYSFGDPTSPMVDTKTGRIAFSKEFKNELMILSGGKCGICLQKFEARYLQIDHRVPYEVAGESAARQTGDFMMLCGSCNRAKSWSCEHCENFSSKTVNVCKACYWADTENYKHVALRDVRRIDLVWTDGDVKVYDEIRKRARQARSLAMPEYVKAVLKLHLDRL